MNTQLLEKNFDSKEYKRSRKAYCIECAFEYFVSLLVVDAFLAKVLTALRQDAFRAGQTHLLIEPSEELLAMENPYDWSARSALGVSAKWDHLLFDGKYYSYYGNKCL